MGTRREDTNKGLIESLTLCKNVASVEYHWYLPLRLLHLRLNTHDLKAYVSKDM